MSVASQQHDEIASELKSSFENNPKIDVSTTSSGSTEAYKVTYRIRGLTTDDNDEIKESRHHVIQITIPFGFPLFPPSCKPISQIFHPDFDPGAICLGDFWDQDRTCSELVEFLGKMISGEIYSRENAFNEKAAVWYIAHADQFPLTDDGEDIVPGAIEDIADFELDTVREEDFSTAFDYTSLTNDEKEENKEEIFRESQEYDLELLQERLSQKRFQQLDRELKSIPINVEFEERDFLRKQTDDALIKSKKLQKKGQELEAADDLEGALEAYTQAKDAVADLYGVEATIQRLQQAISLTKSLGQPKLEKDDQEENQDKISEEKTQTKKINKFKVKIPDLQTNISKKYLLVIPVFFIAWFGTQALISGKQAKNAKKYLSQCQQMMTKRQFQQAQTFCEKAQITSRDPGFLYTSSMNEVSRQANEILKSEKLLKGLEGKILVDGVWVYEDEAIRISPFETLIGQAEQALADKNWVLATKLLRQASPLAKTDQEKALAKELTSTVAFYKAEAEAFQEYDKGGCARAEELLLTAQEKAKDLPVTIRNLHIPEISYRLTKCTFDQLIGEGNKLYEATDWKEALPIYRDALKKIESSPFPERIAVADIKNKISKAELYTAIDQGNRAFASNKWDIAIGKYKYAMELIENDPELSSVDESFITAKKLERIILQAKIIDSKQKIKTLKEESNFAEAITEAQSINKRVQESKFADEKEFLRVHKNLDMEIKELERQSMVEERKQYLIDNYIRFFLKNYPAATEETLTQPVATFISEKNDIMIFKLQATEVGRGRPLALVMFYAYNKTSKQWKFTSNPDNKN